MPCTYRNGAWSFRVGILLADPTAVARKPATTMHFWQCIASALLDWHGRMPRVSRRARLHCVPLRSVWPSRPAKPAGFGSRCGAYRRASPGDRLYTRGCQFAGLIAVRLGLDPHELPPRASARRPGAVSEQSLLGRALNTRDLAAQDHYTREYVTQTLMRCNLGNLILEGKCLRIVEVKHASPLG
jgi:hypothetical protein